MDTVQVDIRTIAAGGAGLGRLPDGRVVFVQRTAPGDTVEARVTKEKRNWAKAELVSIERPAPSRREAPCPHYDRCGGCTLEHMSYDAQRAAKGEIVADALRRIGGLDVEPPDVVASPREFRYRNRVSFTLLRLRGERVVAGFHALDRPGRIVDITEACMLPEPAVAEAWGRLREVWGRNANRLPSGRRLRVTLRGTSTGEVVLRVEGGGAPGKPEELLSRVPGLVSVWHRPGKRGEPRLLAGRETVRERWRGEEVELSGAVFLQVNRNAAERLESYVLDRAAAGGERRVVDAYCGVGLYGRWLARDGMDVIGIDRDERAIEEARRAAPAVEFVAAPVEDHLPDALPTDLVIVNPPRTGLAREVPDALVERAPRRLLYVSCDPATLARDLERLSPAFRLRSLKCFDLFPQTAHVETVAELEVARDVDG